MDITLIRTFIEVANTGSFIAASERLFVTQSAVSLRIQRLEQSLGHALFTRSKGGAILTSAGTQFERYALSLLKVWEEARQQIAIPHGYNKALSIGAEYSLWPGMGFRWIDLMREAMPGLSIHAEVGLSDRITRYLVEGTVQAGLMYAPQQRPGLILEPALDDELILVSSYKVSVDDIHDSFVSVDWGPEFTHFLALTLPRLTDSGQSMALGALAGDYVVHRRASAYLPALSVKRYLDDGKLHVVADAPRFAHPCWIVWRDDLPDDILKMARSTLSRLTQDTVI